MTTKKNKNAETQILLLTTRFQTPSFHSLPKTKTKKKNKKYWKKSAEIFSQFLNFFKQKKKKFHLFTVESHFVDLLLRINCNSLNTRTNACLQTKSSKVKERETILVLVKSISFTLSSNCKRRRTKSSFVCKETSSSIRIEGR